MTIDALKYVKRLEAAGIDRRQAEVHVEALRSIAANGLATKADLAKLENALVKCIACQAVALVIAIFALLQL